MPRTATREQIKAAYRALAFKHSPDRGGDAEAFKRVAEAYKALEGHVPAEARAFIVTPDKRTVTFGLLTPENALAECKRYEVWIKGVDDQIERCKANARHKHWPEDHKGLKQQLELLGSTREQMTADLAELKLFV